MSPVNESEVKSGYSLAERVLQLAILPAPTANFISDYLVFYDYCRLTISLD